jgi:spore germination cell wall hydrolase CwlJ-like protein
MKALAIVIGIFLVFFIGSKTINYKLDSLRNEATLLPSQVTAEVRTKQLDCLARNIYHEAGNEPFEGKAAVAQVTLNRAESGKFPNDICKVVYQKNVVYEKVLCQFSWYCEQATMARPKNQAVYNQSMDAAKQVLLEGFRLPSLKNAMYYHADYVNPKWKLEKVATVGRHIFYSDRPGKGT